jgi:ribosomal protein S18 acetylase RimI-like enzyme
MASVVARRQVQLRPATEQDFGFAERLYLETMRPLLQRLEAWDEGEARVKFCGYYRVEEVRIITIGGGDAGFFQVSEKGDGIILAQIHLEGPYRSQGIGSCLIRDLLRDAGARNLPVSLSVVRHNPARGLYERLGFRVIGEDDTRLHMRWRAAPA